MNTKNPTRELFTKEEIDFMSRLNEFQKRNYLGPKALSIGRGGAKIVSQSVSASRNTIYKAIVEIKGEYTPDQAIWSAIFYKIH